MGFNDYTELKKNIKVNHKVVKVEKLNYREDTGCLTIKDPGKNHNFAVSAGVFVKNSADGRGSQIDTIGGNFSSFAELDDIYYFQRKLYRALKYPMSRVTKMHENQEGDILFAGGRMGEITRDEIK
ncbi:MAG: portal protein [Bacillota bacterium]